MNAFGLSDCSGAKAKAGGCLNNLFLIEESIFLFFFYSVGHSKHNNNAGLWRKGGVYIVYVGGAAEARR